jgi:hypothetical protein
MANKEIERMLNTFTSKADMTIHSNRICYKIKESVKDRELPRLSIGEIEDLKEHLTEFKKINSEGLAYKFLSLRNAFILVREFEERIEHLQKVNEILTYLKQFEYIFELITEASMGKNKSVLDNAMIILDLEINRFCMKYSQILTDNDPIGYKNLDKPIENKKIDYEEIKNG